MKTLTVTYHHTTNYGATFQMFALHKSILKTGNDNCVLETKIPKTPKPKPRGLVGRIRSIYFRWCGRKRVPEMARLQKSFVTFKQNNVTFTRPYTSMDDLRNDPPQVDCLITGSDQVWNLATAPSMIQSRLLQFGSPELVRFSYAASIEHLNYSDEQKQMVKEALKSFKGVSLREESAKEYIRSFAECDCERVLDPVFLLSRDEWNNYAAEPRIKGPYILCYQVQSNKAIAALTKELKRRTGYPVVSITNVSFPWFKADKTFYDVSPEEFLGLYNGASIIVGASFHGVAMGIAFGKPVYALVKSKGGNRIKEIMNLFGLAKFVVHEDADLPVIDYTDDDLQNAGQILAAERVRSEAYLNSMLSNED